LLAAAFDVGVRGSKTGTSVVKPILSSTKLSLLLNQAIKTVLQFRPHQLAY
jgi:hypothetical protein